MAASVVLSLTITPCILPNGAGDAPSSFGVHGREGFPPELDVCLGSPGRTGRPDGVGMCLPSLVDGRALGDSPSGPSSTLIRSSVTGCMRVLLGETDALFAEQSAGVGVLPFDVGETELSRLSCDERCDCGKKGARDGGGSCFEVDDSGEGE